MSRNPVQTRLSILNAAGNLFSRHGYCATSLDDILNAAGITKGAFYHYFKSKEEICSVLLEQALECTRRMFLSFAETNPYEAFEHWTNRILDTGSEEGRAFRLVLRLSDELTVFRSPIPDRLNQFWNEQLGGLEKILTSFESAGNLLPDRRSAALLLLSTTIGLTRLENAALSGVPAKFLLETTLRLILS
ncbi:MAG TPA: TetR/AcrR family transcriptional regulator [Anaerohalosphaeraceae bacterium]|nr:TetR/AcrR family transcriptional regulator [Anaerohalosphaeraceae bacterium]HOL89921.1 TetR/AcrR family transcriptional regulator [Anaerohalosphaeraceae bacterium]HPP57248.1 TetR/AcrR family transcriptional regulator [Anaerohalosphaeraceae bacterium]